MKPIKPGFIIPSSAITVPPKQIKGYEASAKPPAVGDVIFGRVSKIAQHSDLENRHGRSHRLIEGRRAVFVFGNRYAPDAFEAEIPKQLPNEVDVLAKSGIVGHVKSSSGTMKLPTKINVLGYVLDGNGKVLNTTDYCTINPSQKEKGDHRAKLILVIGTQMNSGKSTTAAACCWALSSAGYTVRASKVTGTASLRDILAMEDHGASVISDFSYFGFPSTYLLPEADILRIFNHLDLKYANNPRNFWVVEIADGILQRETAMLLKSPDVTQRIHRLVFAGRDALGVIGGLQVLKQEFGLEPHIIGGICGSSPLVVRELNGYAKVPTIDSLAFDLKHMLDLLL